MRTVHRNARSVRVTIIILVYIYHHFNYAEIVCLFFLISSAEAANYLCVCFFPGRIGQPVLLVPCSEWKFVGFLFASKSESAFSQIGLLIHFFPFWLFFLNFSLCYKLTILFVILPLLRQQWIRSVYRSIGRVDMNSEILCSFVVFWFQMCPVIGYLLGRNKTGASRCQFLKYVQEAEESVSDALELWRREKKVVTGRWNGIFCQVDT